MRCVGADPVLIFGLGGAERRLRLSCGVLSLAMQRTVQLTDGVVCESDPRPRQHLEAAGHSHQRQDQSQQSKAMTWFPRFRHASQPHQMASGMYVLLE
jgi:hypothetical protein